MKKLLTILLTASLLIGTFSPPLNATYIPTVVLQNTQRGTVTFAGGTSAQAVITSVNLAASRVRYLGFTSADTGSTRASIFPRVELTDATHVTAYVNSASGSALTVNFEVISYNPAFVKNIQRGTIAIAGVATNPATVTSVNINKSELDFLGYTSSDTNNNQNTPSLVLTNATTVTASINTAGANTTVGYQLFEWK